MSAAILYGVTGAIGAAQLAAAGCFMGTCTVAGAAPDMPVAVSPQTPPIDGTFWLGYVSGANTVTVLFCNAQAGYVPAVVFDVAVFNSGGSAGGPTLETNGTPNAVQSLLNLIAGTGMTLTADGAGGVTFASAGGGGTVTNTLGALTDNDPMFGNGGDDSKVGTKSGNTNELASVSGVGAAGNLVAWDASGNLEDGGAPPGGTVTHTAGALTGGDPVFGNGGADVKVGTKSGNTSELASVSGVGAAGNLVAWDASGNLEDGGAPPGGTVTHTAGALTAGDPVFGNGGGDVTVGTKSGNTDELASVSSVGASGHLATWDANGNLQDGGANSNVNTGAEITSTSNTSVPNNSTTTLVMGTVTRDDGGFTSTAANTLTVPAGLAGWYIITAQANQKTAPSVTTANYVILAKNGTQVVPSSGISFASAAGASSQNTSTAYVTYLAVGDAITIQVFQTNFASDAVGYQSTLSMARIN